MKFIDLFAGIGGFRYGLEAVNNRKLLSSEKTESLQKDKSNPKKRQIGFTCVYSNEWDKYAAQIYKKHYGEIDTRDITTVPARQIPDHDLLCAGFPCQSFSVAGKRLGFEDTRGTLFFEIARIAKHKRPRYLLLENVKGLLSHDKGKTFQTILGVLADLRYECEWMVLNSKHFGVPQNRERVFIIGHLGGKGRRQVFPIGQGNQVNNKQETQGNDISHTIQNSDKHRGSYIRYPLRYLTRNQKNIEGDYAYTVDSTNTGGVKQGMKIRRLTPTECARLQGFPDNWHEGLSDTRAYKCYGNAVTTTVIQAIGERIKEL